MKRLGIFIGAHREQPGSWQSQTARLNECGQYEFSHGDRTPPFSRGRLALQGGIAWNRLALVVWEGFTNSLWVFKHLIVFFKSTNALIQTTRDRNI